LRAISGRFLKSCDVHDGKQNVPSSSSIFQDRPLHPSLQLLDILSYLLPRAGYVFPVKTRFFAPFAAPCSFEEARHALATFLIASVWLSMLFSSV
jgi:hypothetical protein